MADSLEVNESTIADSIAPGGGEAEKRSRAGSCARGVVASCDDDNQDDDDDDEDDEDDKAYHDGEDEDADQTEDEEEEEDVDGDEDEEALHWQTCAYRKSRTLCLSCSYRPRWFASNAWLYRSGIIL